MKGPTNRTISLTTAMVRLADVAELIKSRSVTDEVLKDLCEDYRLARETLLKMKKLKPKRTKEISEYKVLVSELEEEIIRRLLGAEGHEENENSR